MVSLTAFEILFDSEMLYTITPKLCWHIIGEGDSRSFSNKSHTWLNSNTETEPQAAMIYKPEGQKQFW